MSFLNPDREASDTKRIHVRTYQWSGGEKKVQLDDGSTVKKAFPEIRYYEGSGQSSQKGKAEIPMDIAVLAQTFSVSGFDSQGTAESQVSYFSNETVVFGQPLKVMKKDSKGIEVAAEGSYKQVKDKLGRLIGCQHNVYFYDFNRKCIDRFCFKGSSYGEWGDYIKQIGKASKYTAMTRINKGELKEFPTGDAVVPAFQLLTPYTDEQLAEIKPFAEQAEEFEKYLEARTEPEREEFDQTPPAYDGEQSQEYQEAPSAEPSDMADVPF